MIKIGLEGHDYRYEVERVADLFFTGEPKVFGDNSHEKGIYILSRAISRDGIILYQSFVYKDGSLEGSREYTLDLSDVKSETLHKRLFKRELTRELFILLSDFTTKEIPWGMLTGIRPAKKVHELLEEGKRKDEILSILTDYYRLSVDKADLLYEVAVKESGILKKSNPTQISLYIGIPFCITRCLYCSFTSYSSEKYRNKIDLYLDVLKREIKAVSEMISLKGFKIQTIYIGGGTPTSLSTLQLERLLYSIEENFNLESLEEYTLEAGRPDSIDRDKLKAIAGSRVDRISINPQTMNDVTLKTIGRNHSPEDVKKAFHTARELGFSNINADIIAGLPGEDLGMFINTLEEINEISPESLTVHTMSVKRASRLKEDMDKYGLAKDDITKAMVDTAYKYALKLGMHPYYLYRQKHILGNLENVGYSKPGHESIYNVQIMEEKQTIIAMGAGAVTKVVYPDENKNRLERAFNVKTVEEYTTRIEEMVQRKRQLLL